MWCDHLGVLVSPCNIPAPIGAMDTGPCAPWIMPHWGYLGWPCASKGGRMMEQMLHGTPSLGLKALPCSPSKPS